MSVFVVENSSLSCSLLDSLSSKGLLFTPFVSCMQAFFCWLSPRIGKLTAVLPVQLLCNEFSSFQDSSPHCSLQLFHQVSFVHLVFLLTLPSSSTFRTRHSENLTENSCYFIKIYNRLSFLSKFVLFWFLRWKLLSRPILNLGTKVIFLSLPPVMCTFWELRTKRDLFTCVLIPFLIDKQLIKG